MTKLDVLFDLMTEFVAVLSGHSHITEHEVGFLSAHLLKGRLCIKTGN